MRDFHLPGRSPVMAQNAMVATSHPVAAAEALTILREGGNAVDAAIAAAAILGVCEPAMTGLGGDCFALVRQPGESDIVALNGSGRAPAGLSAEALRDEGLSRIAPGHPASVTVPGAVDGFCRLSERFGRIGLDRVLAPAIRHYEDGVPVAPRAAFDYARHSGALTGDARKHYLPNGAPPLAGDLLRLPGQAEVLRRIVRDGRDAFYTGEIADDMLGALAALGGVHDAEDFARTEATWGAPMSGPYRGRTLIEHPPNGQGATALLLARILQHFDIGGLDPVGPERLHLQAEATKLAFDARDRFIADPDHARRIDHMLSEETAARFAGLIASDRVIAAPAPLTEDIHRETVLATVVDRDGMMVSLIYSIFSDFGSGIASPKFGILFQNRGSGFNLTAGHPNEAGPGKRPLHTIIPAMRATDGEIDMTFGVMGKGYQPVGHVQVLSNLDDHGMDLQEALDTPRSFLDPATGELNLETGIPEKTRAALSDLGHRITMSAEPIGGAQAILVDRRRGILIGASDPRKDGLAIGY